MAAKRILLLDGPFLNAYFWHAGRLHPEGEFGPDANGIESFAGYLARHRSSVFYLLADVAEEGFQLEDLPFVQGADREALLRRRLGQHYYSTPLSTAISLGRARDGRRDEKLLFAALTRIESFTPWLDAVRESGAVLAGVYSVPLVLATSMPRLVPAAGQALLVSLTRGGVRQSFFSEGKLQFSRLSSLATHGIDEIGRTIAGEAAKILQYLVAQRQIPRGAGLRAMVLAHPRQTADLRHHCVNTAEIEFDFVDLVATARRQGLKDNLPDSNADPMFAHCLAVRPPAQQFAPAAERRTYRLWQIRFALTSAAWVVLASCLLYAGKTALNAYELREAIDAAKSQMESDNHRYQGILDGLPKVSLSPENLRALLARFEALEKRAPGLEPLLVHLSQALNDNPRVELSRLHWQLTDRPDAARPEDNRRPPGAATAAPVPVAGPATAGSWMVLEVQAQLPLGLVPDQRAQLDLIEALATRLRDARTQVRVLTRPFDIESDKPLKSTGGDGGDTPAAAAPKFSLRVSRAL